MSPRPYLDASALVKLVLTEPESLALETYLGGAEPLTSRIATVEVRRAVARVRPMDDAAESMIDALWRRASVIELHAAIAATAGRLDPPILRSLDAIHLASAASLGEEIGDFVTYDRRLAGSARSLGLSVVAPA